jgi:WD40 repeat protein
MARMALRLVLSVLLAFTVYPPARAQSPDDGPLHPAVLHRLGTHKLRHGYARSAAFSPDGSLLATGGMDIRLWDAKSHRLVRVLPLPERFVDGDAQLLRFTADGKTLYCQGTGQGQVSAFDVASGKRLFRFMPMDLGAFDISPDGQILATGGAKNQLILWKASTRERLRTLFGPKVSDGNKGPPLNRKDEDADILSVAFSPDAKLLACLALYDDAVRVFDVASGEQKFALPFAATLNTRLLFTPEGYLACGTAVPEGKITLWDLATGKVHAEVKKPWGWLPGYHAYAFSPDGKWMAGEDGKGRVSVWDRATGKVRFTDPRPSFPYDALAFSSDGDTLVACNGAVEMWDLKAGKSVLADEGHLGMIRGMDLTPDGNTLATFDGITVRIWNPRTGKELHRLDTLGTSALALSPDGKTLAINVYDSKNIHLHDVATGKELRRIPTEIETQGLAFSPDGKTIAGNFGDNLTVFFHDVETGKRARRIVGNRGNDFGRYPFPFAFSPDGRHFVSTVRQDEVRLGLWDLSKGEETVWEGGEENIGSLAFSPDGEYLAWTDREDVHILDVRARKQLPALKKAAGNQLRFTPDGRYLVTGKTMHPLDPKHPTRELPFAPSFLAYSRDGSLLVAVAPWACTIQVLDAKKLVLPSR